MNIISSANNLMNVRIIGDNHYIDHDSNVIIIGQGIGGPICYHKPGPGCWIALHTNGIVIKSKDYVYEKVKETIQNHINSCLTPPEWMIAAALKLIKIEEQQCEESITHPNA